MQEAKAKKPYGDGQNPDNYEWVDAVSTPNWKDPREGQPFGKEGESGKMRLAKETFQPRGISDATVLKRQYIETDDEPWHSTCRPAQPLTANTFSQALKSSIGFMAAEDNLTTALSAAKNSAAVEKALAAAEGDGARKGSPAYLNGDKVLKAFQKAEKAQPDLEAKVEELKATLEKVKATAPPVAEKAEEKTEEKKEEGDEAKEEKEEKKDPVAEAEEALKKAEEDVKKSMDAALKARPKAPKKPGAQGSGWDDMKRTVGATHSTNGFN